MDDVKKYVTRGIKKRLGLELQFLIWSMIKEMKRSEDIELDYLQVFNLSREENKHDKIQVIKHTQEVPPYEKETSRKVIDSIEAKIFVVFSVDVEGNKIGTMMLAEEY